MMGCLAAERKRYIDVMRGVGIILVIIGHTGDCFWGWIYSFHMGLFFWVSGYLFADKELPGFWEFVKKKVKNILLPFFVFWAMSFILYLVNSRVHGYSIECWDFMKGLLLGGHWLEITGNFPIWFLQLLFISEIIFWVLLRFIPTHFLAVIALVIACFTTWFQSILPGRPLYHINVLPCALVYLITGYLFNKYLSNNVFFPCSLGIVLLEIGWFIYYYRHEGGNISQIISWWYYIASLFTIVGIYIISRSIKRGPKESLLERIGVLSLYIMGLHSLVINYAQQFVVYFFEESLGVSLSKTINHLLVAFFTLLFTFAMADCYLKMKEIVVAFNTGQN